MRVQVGGPCPHLTLMAFNVRDMKRLKAILISLMALGAVFGESAHASSKPQWLTNQKPQDAIYFYYVGVSGEHATLEEARESAYKSAVSDAVRDRFGVTTQIESDHFETINDTTAITRIRESSSKVNLKGFERIDSYIETPKEGFRVSALYRYPKSEFELEEKRLTSVAPQDLAAPSNMPSIDSNAYPTELVVTTEPNGASVWVDGVPLGKTPLKIKGLLSPGKHKLAVDQPYFEPEERDVVLLSNEPNQIQMLLHPSSAQIVFDNLPAHSEVLIDRQVRRNEKRKFDLIAGRKYRIEVKNPDYQPLLFEEIVFDRHEIKTISSGLIAKPARIKISTTPVMASLSVDGVKVGSAPYSATLAPGSYAVTAHANGYEPIEMTIELTPNGNTAQVLRLVKEKTKPVEVATPDPSLYLNYLSSVRYEVPHAPNPMIMNCGVEAAGSQFTRIDAPMNRISLFVKSTGRNWFGYGAGLSAGTGMGKLGQYDVTVTEELGARLNVNHEFDLKGTGLEFGVEPGYHTGQIELKGKGSDSPLAKKGWSQSSMSWYMGINIYTKQDGIVQIQLGARTFTNSASLQGSSGGFVGLSWGGFL